MILARHAEALYWAGRQLERSEHTTRALDVVARNTMHYRIPRALAEWGLLLDVFGLTDRFRATATTAVDLDRTRVADFLFADATNPGSVVSSVRQLRENIRTVRDRVPVELWEEANRLHLDLGAVDAAHLLHEGPYELFSSVRRGCQTISGVVAEAMPRDDGYTFFDSGRMIERSIMTCRVIRFGLFGEARHFDHAILLRLVSSLQAYRRMVGHDHDRLALAAFLLRTELVPRSVLSCLRRVDDHLETLQRAAPGMAPARQVCGRIRSVLEFGDTERSLADDHARYLLEIESGVLDLGHMVASYAFNPIHSTGLHAQFVRPGGSGP